MKRVVVTIVTYACVAVDTKIIIACVVAVVATIIMAQPLRVVETCVTDTCVAVEAIIKIACAVAVVATIIFAKPLPYSSRYEAAGTHERYN